MADLSIPHCQDSEVAEACRKRGLFGLPDSQEFRPRTRLIEELRANAGPFTIALEVLEAAGWLETNGEDGWRATPKAAELAPGGDSAAVRDLEEVLFGDPSRVLRGAAVDVDAGQPVNEALGVLAAELPKHYLDRKGQLVGALPVLSAWQRHFAEVGQGLNGASLPVEARHATTPLDRLFGECAIGAEAFLVLAAGAGLFNEGPAKRQPLSAEPCEVSVHALFKRDYIVRNAAEGDLDRLWELEELCWQHTRTPKDRILARLQQYPQGQFVLEKDGTILGAIYSQRIADVNALETRTAADVHELHDPSGPIVQLLAVNVDPRVQNASYGDQLLEFMLQRCGLMTGVTKVVGVTLCKSYRAEDGVAFEEYIRHKGSAQDPVLAFHEAHGAEIVKPIAGYRPQDAANLHNGVLVAYDILHRTPRRHAVAEEAEAERPEIAPFLRAEAAKLLGIDESEIDFDRPLMEMGLDSADLLKLQRHCEAAFGLELQAGFFFQYSSLAKVAAYLTERFAPAQADAEPEPVAAAVVEVQPEVSVVEPEVVSPELVSDDDEDFAPAPGDIAVVGMACKLPGGIDTPEQLWQVLRSGQCVISAFPKRRREWPDAVLYPGIDQGGFVEDADAFDAAFFRMSPAEALVTDPQQRMLLEVAWACLEDAGIEPAALKGSKTGVFVGGSNADYSRLVQEAGVEIEAHHGVGTSLAILANRISYFFDLSGPSLVIDTACSASLVALHSAVRSLRNGECAAALVGGVNLICHPDLSIAYHKAGMLASDGRCKVFDARADGYVRSEGAVVLMLKPLHAAIADRNQIHAVIRGTATNHGGLAGGLTVPNPQKQKELLVAAWKDAGIAAQDLSYIEAHGTGTSLGDPIEIQGIRDAYAEMAAGNPSKPCAIGSVKSNLGHLESAAGITGLLKLIVALEHRQLPASVHFAQLNPKISLDDTQFAIQSRFRPWDAGRPRIAGVSSFGSGGTNAHAVVQEYRRRPAAHGRQDEDSLFVLSAATEDRLRVYASRVIDWLERRGTAANFADAIYTWQVGRTAMKHRLAIKVRDHLDLLNKLKQWLAGRTVADAWTGPLAQVDSSLNRVWRTKSGRRLMEQALFDRDLDALAALWASGFSVDWARFHESGGEQERSILSLPTYPFARERYWIDASASKPRAASRGALLTGTTGVLHPLLHANSSDFSQQRYTSTFTGEEFFLADHEVRADGRTVQSVLPGVAYLEMARAAIEQALPARPDSMVLELRNNVWVQPIVVEAPKQVRIALAADDGDEIDYEIYSHDADDEVVHCQGRAVLRHQPPAVKLDLGELAREMSDGGVEPRGVYAAFTRMGLVYGPSFQAVTSVERGSGQLLAHLRLPAIVEDTADDFVLHPSVMDGAVQAAVGLLDGWSEYSIEPRLPFALESLRILGPCTREMVAWVRYAPGSRTADRIGKLDIDLCDTEGNVRAELRGFSLRAPGREKTTASLLIPVWQVDRHKDPTATAEFTQHHVLLCDRADLDAEKLESLLPQSRCSRLQASADANIAQRYSEHAVACFERIQAILRGKPHGRVLVHVVAGGDEEQALLVGLSALLKTAALENPQLVGQLVLVPRTTTAEELALWLKEEKHGSLDTVVRFEKGVRQALRWQTVAPNQEKPPLAFKDSGVYLITGGLGALGLLFAKDILEQTRDARVILTGRSPFRAEQQAILDGLSSRAVYRQLDPANLDDVTQLVASIRQEFGRLDGILHCAGMVADRFILKKEGDEFRQVLAPKVAGTYNLDYATRDVALDFFVLFSSVSGAMGNLGQADYATANAFMDQFAAHRNRLVNAGKRHGRTRSINWPLWQAGGMGNDAATRELLQHVTGMQPLKTAMGLQAFHRSIALPYDQLLVVEGDPTQIRRALLDFTASQSQAARPAAVTESDDGTLAAKTVELLCRELAGVLKLQPHALDPNAALEAYGIDSIVAMRMTNKLEETFGSLPKTLFFEYRTIAELAQFLVEEHSWRLDVLFGASADGAPVAPAAPQPSESTAVTVSRRVHRPRSSGSGAIQSEPIAIIGLSGRYPRAFDVEAYWRNLRDGKDCIDEVPKERWDWRHYFSEDRTKSGRHYSKWGGFIEGVDEFDPLFFNIPPREAKYIDPQERLFLQHAWMAIEDAGYTRAALQMPSGQDLPGQVGVYVGVMYSEYQLFGVQANAEELRMGFAGYVASIANRVSYFLNLHGPSMTVDTMCSSSLTAIHLACQDLRQGRTNMAIAGGVNVTVHPNKYLLLSVGQFISSDGHCASFGEGGDGYIPGEGVGVVVLKRLSEARRDGDHIYGVIRGSALNHGGKTNGYTVPNPQAQAGVIGRALAEAHIEARHISYLEAHGTGTKLGDPIEIAALSKAFQRHTGDTGFCLLGSAKSNIGHCESAAGIAGLTKVLLQMQHQQIVPSLHSAQLNPHIDFAQTPFVVNQTLRNWEQPVIDGHRVPRIAGLSSFGAGGSNAHMIVEEYPAPAPLPKASGPVAIVLSARTPDQLQQKAKDLLDFVRARVSTIDLASMAWTLQTGREPMDERLALVVSSVHQLVDKLAAWVAGERTIEDVFHGQARRNNEALALFLGDDDLQETIEKWLAARKLPKLLSLWVKGLDPDWTKLYGETKPQRISLPAYPFARERYWIDVTPVAQTPAIAGAAAAVLHPLVHANVSDLNEQRYRTTFTGSESFLAGGQVPGAVWLEMARAAVALAMPSAESTVVELRGVVWGEPLVVDGAKPVDIALAADEEGEIEFEIFSGDIVHCRGRAALRRPSPVGTLDLEQLAGAGQQFVPLKSAEPSQGFVLNPAVLDAALQAAGARFPVALDTLLVVAPCTAEMTAWVRGADLDLCDTRGNVCVQLRGVSRHEESSIVETPAVEAPVVAEPPVVVEAPAPAPVVRREIAFASAAPVQRKKPAISLAAPGAVLSGAATARPTITLSSTTVSPAPAAASSVKLFEEGNGIFSIEIGGPAIAAHVAQALDRVREEASLKVVTLTGLERVAGEELERALATFPYPVIAVLRGDAIGASFRAAALCDFLVADEDARYGCGDPAAADLVLLSERFGHELAQDLLFRAGSATGRELRARGWTCPFLPAARIEAHARQLASSLASKSQDALRLLKQHLTRGLASTLAETTLPAEPETDTPAQIESTAHIRVERPAERVLSLTFRIADAKDVVADLVRVFAELAHDTYTRAVVLGSDDPEFLFAIPDEAALEASRVIAEAKIPVVAALSRNAKASAWLIAQSCDARVYNRAGVYSAAHVRPALARTTAAVFAHRLGNAAGEILLTGAEFSGAEIQQRIPVVAIAERAQVQAAAIEIAKSWARLPRTTLAAWKRHSATVLQQKIDSQPAWTEQADAAHAVTAAPVSDVVTLTAHPDGVVVVKMEDRGAKNMFSDALLRGVREAFAHIAATPSYKAVVLTGYDSYFATGGTKESLLAIQQGTAKFTDYDIYRVALDCPLPVIAAMQGHGIGAGWPMGMFADVVLLSDESQYVSPYMGYGFTPGAGATWVLPEKLGQDLGRESLLTAEPITGRELRERGAALRVLPRADVQAAALAVARQIAQTPRERLIALKQQLIEPVRALAEETWRRELAMHEQTFVGRADTLARIESRFAHEERREAPAPTPAPAIEIAKKPADDGDALRAVAAALKTMLAHELQMRESDVDDDRQFVELGLDSISGVTWVRKINEKYQTSIEATKIYSYPTLVQLSRYVKDEAEKKGTLPKPAAVPAVAVTPPPAPRSDSAPKAVALKRTLRGRRVATNNNAPAAPRREAIAVIGMAGRFPQAADLGEFWQNIAQGRNCITEVPRERWDAGAYFQQGEPVPGKTYSRWAGAIDGYDEFDPLFFNISPTEAEHMDPQQRLFLQAAWHAVENAGYDARKLSGSRCGVFVGCTDGDYHQRSRRHQLSAQGFTGSAMSILAARVSYFLDLQGPCVSIDTACSSSLVALAQACDSLVAGNSDLALAGGVYVMVGPEMHIKTSQAGMLSPDGRCFTFDRRANGFVPGEGVGVVLLKRLEDAERDGDIIHAVIHAWGVNQDGKTNGITAPNPDSQARLEQEVYDKFAIDPAQIQLIEAHGTGTKLGDPIEVEGLRNAFGKYTRDTGYCAIGSVKSNIGHCLAAAGIAGTLKLILALKHRQLPPTINFERLNEHIELQDSPFYVNAELRDWTPRGGHARQAATSSFGFSGTNAHIVLGEYVPGAQVPRAAVVPNGKAAIPLSARTPEQLRQKAIDLLAFLRTRSVDLHELAYTLQVGRESMEERLGMLAASVHELADKLQAYLDGGPRVHADASEAGKLLAQWAGGAQVDWNRLYGEAKPRRIELPLYPFAKERYWIEADAPAAAPQTAVLHPLLHSNTSDLAAQRYSSTFTGEEFFLADHRVRARKVLPGAAYLEMARAAVERALPERDPAGTLELRDMVWLEPAVVTDRRRLDITLSAGDDGRVELEVTSGDGETVHCRGQAVVGRQPAPARLDLDALRGRMTRGRMSARDVYALCDRLALHYGPAHQGVTALHLGHGELLAELRLPSAIAGSERDYVLHPSLIDSALQASIGLFDRNAAPGNPPVPFAIDSLRILRPCVTEMFVWVRLEGTKFDIDLSDRYGSVCVQIRGFATRVMPAEGTAVRLPIKVHRSEITAPFDDAFYERLIADVVNRNVSVDEAVEVG